MTLQSNSTHAPSSVSFRRLISLGSNESAFDTKFYVGLIAVDQHVVAIVATQSGLLSVPNAAQPAFRWPYAAASGPDAGQLSDAIAGIPWPLVIVVAAQQLGLVRGCAIAGGQQSVHFGRTSGQQGIRGHLHLTTALVMCKEPSWSSSSGEGVGTQRAPNCQLEASERVSHGGLLRAS